MHTEACRDEILGEGAQKSQPKNIPDSQIRKKRYAPLL